MRNVRDALLLDFNRLTREMDGISPKVSSYARLTAQRTAAWKKIQDYDATIREEGGAANEDMPALQHANKRRHLPLRMPDQRSEAAPIPSTLSTRPRARKRGSTEYGARICTSRLSTGSTERR